MGGHFVRIEHFHASFMDPEVKGRVFVLAGYFSLHSAFKLFEFSISKRDFFLNNQNLLLIYGRTIIRFF